MSAFLAPIHFWLYNKIQIQQDIVEEILKLSKDAAPGLKEELDKRYGVTETKPLEEVIDQGNIHGWLQQRITQTEYKLAFAVTYLADRNKDIMREIELIFYKAGEKRSSDIGSANAEDAYKALNDSLLDGMPCDRVNTVLEQDMDKVVWRRETCVHKSYWEEVGGKIDVYYKLREKFIKGLLSGTSLEYEKIDEASNMIKRREVNE